MQLWLILIKYYTRLSPVSPGKPPSTSFRIKYTFLELRQQIGTFCYHFGSKHAPKLSYYQKAGESGPLERAKDERSRRNILKAVRATEIHMILPCVAMGILHSVLICSVGKLTSDHVQRTPSRGYYWKAHLGFPGFLSGAKLYYS